DYLHTSTPDDTQCRPPSLILFSLDLCCHLAICCDGQDAFQAMTPVPKSTTASAGKENMGRRSSTGSCPSLKNAVMSQSKAASLTSAHGGQCSISSTFGRLCQPANTRSNACSAKGFRGKQ